MALAFAAATLAIVAACSTFGGGETPTGDDAAPPDATRDAAPSDAAPDVTVTFSCAALEPKPTFCNDFDEVPFFAGFKVGAAAGSEAGIDTTFARSTPNSFVVKTPACDQGACVSDVRAGLVAYQTPGPSPSIRAELALYIQSSSPTVTGGGPQVVTFVYDNAYYVALDLSPGGANVIEVLSSDGGVTVPHGFDIHNVAFAKWQRVALSLTANDAGAGSVLALSVDGNDVPLANPQTSMADAFRTANLVVNLGISTVYPPTDAWTVHIDDVVIDQH
jgi:hypothetical protein